eukprot:gene10603-2725_t
MDSSAESRPSALSRVAFFEQKAKQISLNKTENMRQSKGLQNAGSQDQAHDALSSRSWSQSSTSSSSSSNPTKTASSISANNQLSTPGSPLLRARFSTILSSQRPTVQDTSMSASRAAKASSAMKESGDMVTQVSETADKLDVNNHKGRSSVSTDSNNTVSHGTNQHDFTKRPNPMSIKDRLALFNSAPSAEHKSNVNNTINPRATFSACTSPEIPKSKQVSGSNDSVTSSKLTSESSSENPSVPQIPSIGEDQNKKSRSTLGTASVKESTGQPSPQTPQSPQSPQSPQPVQTNKSSSDNCASISHLLPKHAFAGYTPQNNQHQSRRYTASTPLRKAEGASDSNRCSVCQKPVFAMEKVSADGIVLHKWCFRCAECNCKVSLGTYASLDGVIYCKPHFKQLFQLRGRYTFHEEAIPDVVV